MMRKHAFTMIELIASISIVMVLVGILVPVFRSARERSLILSSLLRLKQMHVAVTIYRADWDAGNYENQYGAGLPSYAFVYGTYLHLGRQSFRSPCGYKPNIEGNVNELSYQYAPMPTDAYSKYLSLHREESILMNDPHCNPDSVVYGSPFTKKRGLGVLLSGRLINQYKTGSPGDLEWWTPNSEAQN